MVKPLTTSFPEVYAAVANDLMTRLGDSMAIQAGPPIGDPVEPATDEDRVKAWNARNPAATDEAMLQLAQQKYQEHIGAGMTPDVAQKATAEDLTHFRYGQRLKLYTYGQVDFKSQVEEAKRIKRLAARASTPYPSVPPPSMPSAIQTNLATDPTLAQTLGVPPIPPAPPPAAPAAPASLGLTPAPAVPPAPSAAPPLQPPIPGGYPTLRSGEA